MAGLVILLMALTGIVLASEDFLLGFAERKHFVSVPQVPDGEVAERLGPQELATQVTLEMTGTTIPFVPASLRYRSELRAPVLVQSRQGAKVYAHPYTGTVLSDGPVRVERLLQGAEAWHRWLNFPDRLARNGRSITGAVNLVLLLLLLTGPVLWLPWRSRDRQRLKRKFLIRRGLSGSTRRRNWHYVVGIWSLAPLLVIAVTGVMLSYPGLGDKVYPVVGGWVTGADVSDKLQSVQLATDTDFHGGRDATPAVFVLQGAQQLVQGSVEVATANDVVGDGALHLPQSASEIDVPVDVPVTETARAEPTMEIGARQSVASDWSAALSISADPGVDPYNQAGSSPTLPLTRPANVSPTTFPTRVANQDLSPPPAQPLVDLAQLFLTAQAVAPAWKIIELSVPQEGGNRATAVVQSGGAGQPQHSGVLTWQGSENNSEASLFWRPFSEESASRRGQQFLRYAHTGEYWGIVGRILLALASLATAVLVWTGMRLAITRARRRLTGPNES